MNDKNFKKMKLEDFLEKKLTTQEVEVLSLWASRNTDSQIAEILHISKRTVQNHIRNIFLYKISRKKFMMWLFFTFRQEITKMGGYKIVK